MEIKPLRIGGLWDGETRHQAGSVWDKELIAPCLDTAQGGNRQCLIIVNSERENSYGESKKRLIRNDI